MAFPTPIFAIQDWSSVWVFPMIMAVLFGLFKWDRDAILGGDRRPALQRVLANFILYGSVWIPFKVFGAAIERGAAAEGFGSPEGWRFGLGLLMGLIVFFVLMAVSATVEPVQNWLGYNRNPFKSAGKS